MTPFDTNAARSIQVYRAAKPRVLFLVRYFQPCSSPSCLLTLFRCPSSLLVPSLLLTPHSIPSEFWRVSSLLFLTFLAVLVFLRSPAPPPAVIQNFSPTPSALLTQESRFTRVFAAPTIFHPHFSRSFLGFNAATALTTVPAIVPIRSPLHFCSLVLALHLTNVGLLTTFPVAVFSVTAWSFSLAKFPPSSTYACQQCKFSYDYI